MRGSTSARGSLIGLLGLLVTAPANADDRCKEQCEAERKKTAQKLEECLQDVDPRPQDRAAKMRLLCRQRYALPRCDGLPPCQAQRAPTARPPAMKLGPIVFSTERRGPRLAQPRYAPGREVFLSVEVEITPKPDATRIWLELGLRLLALEGKGKTREVARWDSYAEEQRMIAPPERGMSRKFTLHGGAKLPPDQEPGTYQIVATVKEKGSGFEGTAQGSFTVK